MRVDLWSFLVGYYPLCGSFPDLFLSDIFTLKLAELTFLLVSTRGILAPVPLGRVTESGGEVRRGVADSSGEFVTYVFCGSLYS